MSASTAPTPILREVTLDDADALTAVENACSLAEVGHETTSVEDLRRWLLSPDRRPGCWVAAEIPGEGMLGYANVIGEAPFVSQWGHVFVHPGAKGQGIGARLLGWCVSLATRLSLEAPVDAAPVLHVWRWESNSRAAELFEANGFREIRSFYTMALQMDALPDPAPLPNGISVRPIDVDREARAAYDTHIDAFSEHFGLGAFTYEAFRFEVIDDVRFDPRFLLVAVDGSGELVGTCTLKGFPDDNPEVGIVEELAVREPWRRRGIGTALLTEGLRALHARGLMDVALDVDASNETGAVRLYERLGMYIKERSPVYEKALR